MAPSRSFYYRQSTLSESVFFTVLAAESRVWKLLLSFVKIACLCVMREKIKKRRIKQKAGQSLIELKNAGFTYGGRDILSEMTLHLQPGSFHFLTGPSGSGKTTLLNLCYQALLPTTGMVRIFEQDVRAMTRDDIAKMRRRIGVVHQNCQFLDHLTVRENLALPLAVSGREDDIHPSNLDDLLGWVGLTKRGDALPPELSGGERQRAALARAIIMSPDLLLADEPTGNVDWEMAQRLMALLVELNKMGKTILIATHDLNLIRTVKSEVSARVLRISNSKLQLAGADL
jgi:cell division transport system ATP-binding protein